MKKSKKQPTVLLRKKHFKQELKASCVAAAARMMLGYHGISDVSEAELRRILKTKPKGTHLINLLFLNEENVIINDPIMDDKELRIPATMFFNAWGKNQYYMIVIKKKKV